MPFNSGPGLMNEGLVFHYSMFNVTSFRGAPTTNLITTNSDGMTGGSWVGYCGNDTNIEYNTSEVLAPNGTYTASKITRKHDNTTCGSGGAWGRIWAAGNGVAGSTYTASMWVRAQNTTTIKLAFNDCNGAVTTITTEWKRISYTDVMNTCGNQGMRGFQFILAEGSGPVYFWGAQLELGSFATPYQTSSSGTGTLAANGSRITDGGVLQDLTGNSRIIANALRYASDNTFFFNGVTDYITVPENNLFNIRNLSGAGVCIEAWIKPYSLNQNGFIFERGPVNTHYSLFMQGTNLILRSKNTDGQTDSLSVSTSSLQVNKWNHIFGVIRGNAKVLYINGSTVGSQTTGANIILTNPNANAGCSIGVYGGYSGARSYYYNGQIGVVRVYVDDNTSIPSFNFFDGKNVSRNFNALRNRFGV